MAHVEIIDEKLVITVPVEKVTAGTKSELEERLRRYTLEVIPVKKLSTAQNALIHVLLQQYADELGWYMIDMKSFLKEQFSLAYDLFNFETSKCDMQLANEFIAFIIEHAIDNGINLYIMNKQDRKHRHILEIDSITQRYVIACLRKKMCAITGMIHDPENGKFVELDHWQNVNTIGGYENCNGLKTQFISLSKQMHDKKHTKGREEFKNLYHIEGVWLNPKLVKELKEVYPNQFKAFKEEEYGV
ncbi:MAG: hypothetical protein LBV03_04050 [Fusobacteriales bacterium]|jgi:hypothetical protein|nr:hypothetical protein [Fusobacteriales bacterium]